MTPERWARAKQIFQQCVTGNQAISQTALAEMCGEDEDLRVQVWEMLDLHWKGQVLARVDDESTPAMIGPYRVVREIGRGGAGIVFEARRVDGEFDQRVAVKVMRMAWDAQLAERFRQERQMLAMVDHPHIARLLDGGTLASGEP
ncbi:MAG: protein kinase [Bryobacterales bacterium]|nr:protein kinase [Bryobacterales bacterium]